jgi:hypothetical protein
MDSATTQDEIETNATRYLYAAALRACLAPGVVTGHRIATALGVEYHIARDMIALLEADGLLRRVWILQPDAVDRISGKGRLCIASE